MWRCIWLYRMPDAAMPLLNLLSSSLAKDMKYEWHRLDHDTEERLLILIAKSAPITKLKNLLRHDAAIMRESPDACDSRLKHFDRATSDFR